MISHHPPLIPWRDAVRMLRPVHGHVIACACLGAIGAAVGLAPYVAITEIARQFLGAASADRAVIWAWVGIGAAGALARLVFVALDSHVGHHADAKILHRLRVRLVERLGVVPLGWFRRAGSGELKKAMTGDLEDMHDLFAHAIGGFTGALAGLLVGIGYLSFVDLPMAAITAAVPALALLVYRFSMRSMPEHTARLIAAERRISVAAVEYADGFTVARTYGGGGRLLERFRAATDEHAAAFRVWVREVRYSSALSRILSSELTVLAVVTTGGMIMIAIGRLTPIELLPFLVVGVGLPTSLIPMIHGSIAVRTARLAGAHLDGLLSLPALPEPEQPRRPEGFGVELDEVEFSYDGTTPVLRGVTATLRPGTLTALVGPSGAGKTTLATLVPRFYDVTGGAIRIGGVDLRQLASTELLSSVSLVFQDVVTVRDTIAENIRIARPGADLAEIEAAARAAQLHDVIMALPDGYDTVLDQTVSGLSGGERQRLTIARAIIADAPIVILDEATAALDPDHEAAVQTALSALVAGKTVLVIAHRLQTITEADQILVLDAGRIVERGRHRELLDRDGRYARLWAAQAIEAVA
ncbi:ABC transporter ATP-binding protein [Microlunatus speluncae]|uniref:ABC transporter ATP-binding protein n=1 Tax=Microlunatus speluncae TaxID=2594267 RepID=UPI001C2CE518|nr:ABC transporter ATP-binding protein [Microlunatus speluncae]